MTTRRFSLRVKHFKYYKCKNLLYKKKKCKNIFVQFSHIPTFTVGMFLIREDIMKNKKILNATAVVGAAAAAGVVATANNAEAHAVTDAELDTPAQQVPVNNASDAQKNADSANQALKDAQKTADATKDTYAKAQQDTTDAQTNLDDANKNLDTAKQNVKDATPENIAKAQKDVDTAQANYDTAKKNDDAAKATYDQAKKDADDAQAKVNAAQAKVAESTKAVQTAQDAMDNKGKAEAEAQLAQAQKALEDAQQVAKDAPQKLADATKAAQDAKAQLDKANSDLADAKANAAKAQQALQTAKSNYDATHTSSVDSISLPSGYASDLQEYRDKGIGDQFMPYGGNENFVNESYPARNVNQSLGITESTSMKDYLLKHPYQHKAELENEVIAKVDGQGYEPKDRTDFDENTNLNIHLTDAQVQQLSSYAAGLINQIRSQVNDELKDKYPNMHSQQIKVSNGSTKLASDMVNKFINSRSYYDSLYKPGAWNYTNPLNIKYTENAVEGEFNTTNNSQYSWDSKDTGAITMDRLMEHVYYSVLNMIYNDLDSINGDDMINPANKTADMPNSRNTILQAPKNETDASNYAYRQQYPSWARALAVTQIDKSNPSAGFASSTDGSSHSNYHTNNTDQYLGVSISKYGDIMFYIIHPQDNSTFDTSAIDVSNDFSKYSTLNTKAATSAQELSEAQQANSDAQSALQKATDDEKAAQANADTTQKAAEDAKAAADNAQPNVQKAQDAVTAAQKTVDSFGADDATKKANLDNAKAQLATDQKALDDAQADLKTKQDALAKAKEALDAADKALAEAQDALDKAKARLDALQNAPEYLTKAEQAVKDAEQRLEQAKVNEAEAKKEYDEAQAALADAQKKADSANQTLAMYQAVAEAQQKAEAAKAAKLAAAQAQAAKNNAQNALPQTGNDNAMALSALGIMGVMLGLSVMGLRKRN